MNKKYSLGAIVGRFQIIHKGHAQVIEQGIAECEEFIILVGSSQESMTAKNPFSFEERKEMLSKAFPKAKIYPLPDIGVGNCSSWGDYVVDKVEEYCQRKPDVFYSGEEERRVSWIDPKHGIKTVFAPKSVNISATRMKEYLCAGDRASWKRYAVPSLEPEFDKIRQKIVETASISNTQSI